MQIDSPDPTDAGLEQSRVRFRRAAQLAIAFVALLWLMSLLQWGLDSDPGQLGLRPRDAAGLAGIFFAPLLHGGFAHLLSNSLPLLVVGTTMLYLYPSSSRWVLPLAYLGPGVLVWLGGRSAVHIGASGLVYGLVAYVFVAGLMRRDRRAIAASLLVSFMYGALVWGVLPLRPEVSWETHLAAALLGVALAFALRQRDIPPRRRYSWEDEACDDDTPAAAAPLSGKAVGVE
jgi:membrane associated rhomboid family serine protease